MDYTKHMECFEITKSKVVCNSHLQSSVTWITTGYCEAVQLTTEYPGYILQLKLSTFNAAVNMANLYLC